MEHAPLETLAWEQADAPYGTAPPEDAVVPARGGRSLMTPLGVTAGEVLTEVESLRSTTLRQLIRKLDWPVYLVMMAVGVLVRQGLVRATQRELEVIVEPIPEWSG